jgi:hypothetical protein
LTTICRDRDGRLFAITGKRLKPIGLDESFAFFKTAMISADWGTEEGLHYGPAFDLWLEDIGGALAA